MQEDLAERIIAILRGNADALETARNEIARRTSADPGTISNDAIFKRIRQDSELQTQIALELSQLGYDMSGPRINQAGKNAKSRFFTTTRAGRSRREANATTVEERDEPQLKQRPSPYPDLPSLKDLYSQLPSGEGKLKRFGSDIFRLGTGNADDLPMDLPVGPDYCAWAWGTL